MTTSAATRRALTILDQELAAEIERGQIVYICGHAVRVLSVTRYPESAGGRAYVTISPKVYGLSLWREWEVRLEPMPEPNENATDER